MRLLLEQGADPKARAEDGTTALIAAVNVGEGGIADTRVTEKERLAAVRLALEVGNEIEAETDRGVRAIHAASLGGLLDVIRFLHERGADLNAMTKPRTTTGGGCSSAVRPRSGWRRALLAAVISPSSRHRLNCCGVWVPFRKVG